MTPTIAVLIPYFNERTLLTECLQSLLRGDDVPDEILIYDDASEYPAQDYIPPHAGIQIIRGDSHHGASYGRNKLLELSVSNYVHYHDSDDLFDKDWCETIREAIRVSYPDIVLTNSSSIIQDQFNSRIFDFSPLEKRKNLADYFIQHHTRTIILTFRRELASGIGGYQTHELTAALDYYFNIRLAAISQSYVLIDKDFVIARFRANSLSLDSGFRLTKHHRIQAFRALEYLSTELASEYLTSISEMAANIASDLYRWGDFTQARMVFEFATRIGRPQYMLQGRIYRFVAHKFNPIIAECLSASYRKAIPLAMRTRLYKMLTIHLIF